MKEKAYWNYWFRENNIIDKACEMTLKKMKKYWRKYQLKSYSTIWYSEIENDQCVLLTERICRSLLNSNEEDVYDQWDYVVNEGMFSEWYNSEKQCVN